MNDRINKMIIIILKYKFVFLTISANILIFELKILNSKEYIIIINEINIAMSNTNKFKVRH